MPSATSDTELLSSLRVLVEHNSDDLFGLVGADVDVERLSLGRPLHRKQSRYHRMLTIRYSRGGTRDEKRLWLKFLPRARTLYDIHTAVWTQTRDVCNLFPRPYFYGEWSGGEVVAMEVIEGRSLRRLFLRFAVTRRSVALNAVFKELGEALRAFHDSSAHAGFTSAHDLYEDARRAVVETDHLTRDEQEEALDRIAVAAEQAGGSTRLPHIPVHHDCTLRNIVVRQGGVPCLLDLDSMRAEWKSRWFDVAVFLTNLESQAKYGPLADAESVALAWGSFWTGYMGTGPPDGLSRAQTDAVLFIMKVELAFRGPWLPVFEVYAGFLGSRYLRRLKQSVLRGEHLSFDGGVAGAA